MEKIKPKLLPIPPEYVTNLVYAQINYLTHMFVNTI